MNFITLHRRIDGILREISVRADLIETVSGLAPNAECAHARITMFGGGSLDVREHPHDVTRLAVAA